MNFLEGKNYIKKKKFGKALKFFLKLKKKKRIWKSFKLFFKIRKRKNSR